MKPFIAILIGLALLTIALLMGRTSLNHWVGGEGSENFRRGVRKFNQFWYAALGLIFLGSGLWLLFKR